MIVRVILAAFAALVLLAASQFLPIPWGPSAGVLGLALVALSSVLATRTIQSTRRLRAAQVQDDATAIDIHLDDLARRAISAWPTVDDLRWAGEARATLVVRRGLIEIWLDRRLVPSATCPLSSVSISRTETELDGRLRPAIRLKLNSSAQPVIVAASRSATGGIVKLNETEIDRIVREWSA